MPAPRHGARPSRAFVARAAALPAVLIVLFGAPLAPHLAAPAVARRQQPARTTQPTPTPDADDEVLTVNTNLVQVDAVVTDGRGRQVTDLQAADFEIVEGGRTRRPDFLTYVPLAPARAGHDDDDAATPDQLSTHQLRRTFVFIVANPQIDVTVIINTRRLVDVRSFTLRPRALRAAEEAARTLGWFIDNQLGPNDLAAIAATETNLGVLSSFTSDRRVLRAAVERVRQAPAGGDSRVIRLTSTFTETGSEHAFEPLVRQNLSVLRTASEAVEQLKTLPGRKFVVLLSRGMLFDPRFTGSQTVRERMRELIERANRERVTFYTLSPNGLGDYGGTGPPAPRGVNLGGPSGLGPAAVGRGVEDLDSLSHLARETGGRAIYNTNDARVGLGEILEQNGGYYLLAYNPGGEATARPHRVQVRVLRAGLTVRARSTAYAAGATARTDGAYAKGAKGAAAALNSPLAAREIALALTPAVEPAADGRAARVRARLHVDLSEFELETKPGGGSSGKLELMISVAGPDGNTVGQAGRVISLSLANDGERRAGFDADFDFEAARPGFYRINVAARDAASGRVGSAARFVEVARSAGRK